MQRIPVQVGHCISAYGAKNLFFPRKSSMTIQQTPLHSTYCIAHLPVGYPFPVQYLVCAIQQTHLHSTYCIAPIRTHSIVFPRFSEAICTLRTVLHPFHCVPPIQRSHLHSTYCIAPIPMCSPDSAKPSALNEPDCTDFSFVRVSKPKQAQIRWNSANRVQIDQPSD
jgi:hypothetical protein